jgi:hypothetical protein
LLAGLGLGTRLKWLVKLVLCVGLFLLFERCSQRWLAEQKIDLPDEAGQEWDGAEGRDR